jgi:hypothetical protein
VRYRVELQPTAERDIERAYRNLQQRAREGKIRSDYPEQWYEEIEDALYLLEEPPSRCPAAPEAQAFRSRSASASSCETVSPASASAKPRSTLSRKYSCSITSSAWNREEDDR